MKKEPTDTNLENLPPCVIEFIKLIIQKMRYRKKVLADVQAELIDHFNDELQYCKTDQEKQQAAEKLITEFGDVKILATLMRRAKKRCRPLWRTIVVRTFQTIGVLILCQIIYIVWFLTGKPAPTIDYLAELNRITRPVAEESQNAEPLYTQAAELFEKSYDPNDPQNIKEIVRLNPNEATPQQKTLIQNWLDENTNILDMVTQGSQKPYYWLKYSNGPTNEAIIGVMMPSLGELRDFVKALCWQSYLLAEKDQMQAAFADIKTTYRIGLHFQGKKFLIEQLVGTSIRRFSTRTLVKILYEHKTDPAILANLQKDLQQLASQNTPAINFSVEKLFIYDETQRCFTNDHIGGGHLYLQRIRDVGEMDDEEFFVLTLQALFTNPNKQQTIKAANQLYTFCDKMAYKTPGQLRKENIDLEKQAREITEGNILLEIFMPAIHRACELHHRGITDTQAALTIIALVRYQQQNGSYPDSLTQLKTAGYLQKLPIDLYSDQPLIYKKTADTFLLYSIGPDFTDNNGQPAVDEDGNRHRWPQWNGDKNTDAIFWPPQ